MACCIIFSSGMKVLCFYYETVAYSIYSHTVFCLIFLHFLSLLSGIFLVFKVNNYDKLTFVIPIAVIFLICIMCVGIIRSAKGPSPNNTRVISPPEFSFSWRSFHRSCVRLSVSISLEFAKKRKKKNIVAVVSSGQGLWHVSCLSLKYDFLLIFFFAH